jgi:hypothetical protein
LELNTTDNKLEASDESTRAPFSRIIMCHSAECGNRDYRGLDVRRPGPGRPQVPAEWSRYLIAKPVTAKISEVVAEHVAVLNAGATNGLKAGMELTRENIRSTQGARVLFCEEKRSFVRIVARELYPLPESSPVRFQIWIMRPQPFRVGEKLSAQESKP